jgi:hypothetical protein
MSESMLTSEAANTSEGQAASQGAATDATQGAANGQPQGDQGAAQQQGAEGQTAAEGAKPAGEGADGDAGKAEDKPGAPEKYEFKAPEGKEYDPETLTRFSDVARKHNLTQESAQSLLDDLAPMVAERQAQVLDSLRTEWAESSQADKEFGGAAIKENLAVAKQAMEKFGTPELRTLLNESGLGNHPEVIRFMFRAGKAISEDKFVPPSVGGLPSNRGAASVLYPSQQK